MFWYTKAVFFFLCPALYDRLQSRFTRFFACAGGNFPFLFWNQIFFLFLPGKQGFKKPAVSKSFY